MSTAIALVISLHASDWPDPLKLNDGSAVSSPESWTTKRRPELKELFQEQMYGRFPGARQVSAKALFEDRAGLGGKAVVSEFAISVAGAEDVPFHLLLITPAKKPEAPIFLGLNFCGNHAIIDDVRVRIPTWWMYDRQPGVVNNRATAEGRGKQKDVWPVDDILAAGYGLATIYGGDI